MAMDEKAHAPDNSNVERQGGRMKVLRLTRHAIVPEQLAELQRLYGADCEILEISETVPNSARVTEMVRAHNADVVEAVLPFQLLAEVVGPDGCGIPVIRAITRRVFAEDGVKVHFVFSHYEKVLKVEVVTERL